jgi:hypothetical protein
VDVVASASPDFIKEWAVTAFKNTVHISPLKQVIPNQTFYVAAIVIGYGVNTKGLTDLTRSFVLQNLYSISKAL